jgi:hypothetical protein
MSSVDALVWIDTREVALDQLLSLLTRVIARECATTGAGERDGDNCERANAEKIESQPGAPRGGSAACGFDASPYRGAKTGVAGGGDLPVLTQRLAGWSVMGTRSHVFYLLSIHRRVHCTLTLSAKK